MNTFRPSGYSTKTPTPLVSPLATNTSIASAPVITLPGFTFTSASNSVIPIRFVESDIRQSHSDFDASVWVRQAVGGSVDLDGGSTTAGQDVPSNLERVRSQIADAAKKSGRSLDEIELIAISKTHEAEKVRAAFDAGHQIFGESRVQEARAKIPLLPSSARWHFVGRLQKNKIRHALPLFELFHSVDSIELARDMNRIADEEGLHPRVLLEVNVAGEGSKIGFAPDSLRAEMEMLLELPRLTIEGLMTIPPLAPEAEASRKYFSALRDLRDQFALQFQVKLPQLSMGMSDDFAIAIEEGATLVRVGTAIFGKRTPARLRDESAPG